MRNTQICPAILASAWSARALADVKPSQLFSDHAVLQSEMPVPIWGTADPGERVIVTPGTSEQSAITGADGKWMINLRKMSPGGRFTMTITGKNIELHQCG